MSTRTITERVCDWCLKDDRRVLSSFTYTVAVVDHETTKVNPKVLDACTEHNAMMTELRTLIESAVTADPGVVNWRARNSVKKAREATKQQPIHMSPSQLPAECPICSDRLSTRGALVNHVWTQHAQAPRPAMPRHCGECDRSFVSHQVAQRHATIAHGFDALQEALNAAMAGAGAV